MAGGAFWTAPDALAACAPAAGAGTPASGTTVTCSGATTNQNFPSGYGDGSQNGLTINVQPGAAVTGTADGFHLNDNNTVTNFGAITGNLSEGIQADTFVSNTLTVNNYGVISASDTGVVGANVVLTNTGTITAIGGTGIEAFGTATIVNSGTISAASGGIAGINVFGGAGIVNSGTISGPIGLLVGTTSTLSNSGTIIGLGGGRAIDFSTSSGDTLNFLPGSRIQGTILLGTGDTVNISSGRDISSLLTFGSGGSGIVDTGSTVNVGGGAPFAVGGNRVAVIDPTAFAMADRALMDFTGGVSSLIADRLDDNPSGMAVVAAGAPLAVASDADRPLFGAGIDSSTTAWAKAFGGARRQRAAAPDLGATGGFGGGAIGIDRLVTPDLRLGALVGAGAGSLGVDLGSQTVDTVYGFAGAYGRYDWSGRRLDFALTGGPAQNTSTRLVANNLAANGFENANARYNNWFASPEVGLSQPVPAGGGATIIPAARLRYMAAWFEGYSESGSSENLTVRSRTVQDLEGRLEVTAANAVPLPAGWPVRTRVTAGILDLARLGSTAVNAAVIGQSLQFAAPGKSNVLGIYGSLGADYRLSDRVTAFADADFAVMNDNSFTGTGRVGLRMQF